MGAGGSETRAILSAKDAASAFGAILDALSGAISPALIDAIGWRRVRDTVQGLPVDSGTGFGFELRLGESAASADIYVMLPRTGALAEHFIRHGEWAGEFGDRLAAIETRAPWAGILAVEYDVAAGPRGAPPGLFVRIRSDPAGTGAADFPAAETVAGWLAGAVGWRLEDRERRALTRTFDAMSAAGVAVDCLGIMPGRPARAYKVNSRSMEPARTLPVLEKLGWNGPAGAVATFLSAFEGTFRTLRIAVGVTADGVQPRIGLELFQGEAGSLSHPGAGPWGPFLARLCERGLCLPEKLDGLMDWPGRELVFCGRKTFGLLTGVAHVKISFEARDGGTVVEAKAYPVAGYLPFDAIGSRFAAR